MDRRLLAVDGNRLSVGIRELGYSAAIHRSVGPRTLGAEWSAGCGSPVMGVNNRRSSQTTFRG